MSDGKGYTVVEAAKKRGVHPNTLTRWIRAGLVPGAEKVQGRYLIPRKPFDRWVDEGVRIDQQQAAA